MSNWYRIEGVELVVDFTALPAGAAVRGGGHIVEPCPKCGRNGERQPPNRRTRRSKTAWAHAGRSESLPRRRRRFVVLDVCRWLGPVPPPRPIEP